MTDTYLTMMEESLDRKIGVLRAIEAQNEAQREIMKREGEPDTDAFDATVAEKDRLVEEGLKLNDGFDSLYERVREELNDHKDLYGERIKRMQDKIGEITALSTSIEATEQRNKTLAEKFFAGAKENLGENRKSANAAINYYRNMSKSNFYDPQFMDKKN